MRNQGEINQTMYLSMTEIYKFSNIDKSGIHLKGDLIIVSLSSYFLLLMSLDFFL